MSRICTYRPCFYYFTDGYYYYYYLLTSVLCLQAMHLVAEYGCAAHWAYAEDVNPSDASASPWLQVLSLGLP